MVKAWIGLSYFMKNFLNIFAYGWFVFEPDNISNEQPSGNSKYRSESDSTLSLMYLRNSIVNT